MSDDQRAMVVAMRAGSPSGVLFTGVAMGVLMETYSSPRYSAFPST
ncbi:MAG: hypothetical protein VX290_05835 [Candidatus Latescibacterota bacterium]|nr:hypothetical protein [Candidatus Latescibacterota bacterium]